MRGRKEHAITAVGGDAQPSRVVAVAVDVELTGDPAAPTGQREVPVRWACCGWERRPDGTARDWTCEGTRFLDWWRAWHYGAKRGGVTWLVSTRTVRVASLVNLWGEIDDGRIEWDGAGHGPDATQVLRGDLRQVRGIPAADDRLDGPSSDDGVPALSDQIPPRTGHTGATNVPKGRAAGSVIVDDPPTILRLRMPGRPGKLWWVDSRNWGIEAAAPFASCVEEAAWLSAALWRMTQWLSGRGWGGLKPTAGSQALYTWRRAFMTHEVICHDDDEALEIEGSAYVGGRCECNRLGVVSGPLVSVDRRSAYAHACRDVSVPVRILGRLDGDVSALRKDATLALRCVAECGVDTDEPDYPCRRGGRITYPVGRLATVLAGPELADAVRRDRLRWVGRVVLYDCLPALRAYASALWDARLAFDASDDEALGQWVKKLLVSLPGKMGQRCGEWRDQQGVIPRAKWCAWWGVSEADGVFRLRSLSGWVQRQTKADWTYDSAPAVACWILSAARVALLDAIRAAGRAECLYWDTDSLLLTAAGWARLQATPGACGDGLGQWRVVREVSEAVIIGVKHYQHDGATTCAGMPRQDVADARIRDHYWYRQTFGQALSDRVPPAATRRLRRYARAARYEYGRVGDGGVIHPFVVEDW